EVELVQNFYNKMFKPKIKADGKLGPQTRDAVKRLQRMAKLPQDGYPDYRLINKIKNYNHKHGFRVLPPPRKSKKK
ncbi:MAG: peptidoglycan-binding protein, partial [Alphaproteobacteria bacterium]|nr:peptidoglycan-binding protein [Alphaproteobacteria bacterium]